MADRQARGEYTYEQVYEEITKYHQSTDASTQEADIVSLRIVEMLSQNGFSLRPTTLLHIHKELFQDLFDSSIPVGEYRTVNITKNEPVLKGDTVIYSDFPLIVATLDYDFQQERDFLYARLDKKAIVAHIQSFISGIWQYIHSEKGILEQSPYFSSNTFAHLVSTLTTSLSKNMPNIFEMPLYLTMLS